VASVGTGVILIGRISRSDAWETVRMPVVSSKIPAAKILLPTSFGILVKKCGWFRNFELLLKEKPLNFKNEHFNI